MRLSGRLESRGLESILWEIHENAWSGTLRLFYEIDDEEVFFLFDCGRLLTCQRGKGTENLPQELIQQDVLSVGDLQKALGEVNARQERLERILVEQNILSEEKLAQGFETILAQRLKVYVTDRATLPAGYSFETQEGDSSDLAMPDLALPLDSLFLAQGADIPNMLERAGGFLVSLAEEEIPGALIPQPGAEASFQEDLFGEMTKELGFGKYTSSSIAQDEMSVLKEMLDELNAHGSKNEKVDVILLILRYASQVFPRGILFQLEDANLKSVGEFGFENPEDVVVIRALRLPVQGLGLLDDILGERRMRRGPMEDLLVDHRLLQVLGGDPRREIFLSPICSGQTVKALFCGDPDEKGGFLRSFGLEIFLNQVGVALEKKFLRDRLEELEKPDARLQG